MTRTLWHGCTGSVGARVVKEDVYVSVCGGVVVVVGLLRANRVLFASPERQDLIWRVPRPLFPTICLLHCQGGGERGEL